MENVFEYYSKQEGFQEIYETVRTAIVAYDNRYFRIEVLRNHHDRAGTYATWIWEEKGSTWVHYPIVGGNAEDSETALSQALGFLSGETLS